MNFLKAFLYTIFYILCALLSIFVWTFVLDEFHIKYTDYYDLITSSIVLILTFIFIKKTIAKPIFQRTATQWFYWAILLGVLFILFQDLTLPIYYFVVKGGNLHFTFNYNFDGLNKLLSFNILSIIFIASAAEELFFRRFLLEKLKIKYTDFWAVVISAFLFALVHFPFQLFSGLDYDFSPMYTALFGGLLAGFLYVKSKSVLPSLVFHIVWNLLVSIL